MGLSDDVLRAKYEISGNEFLVAKATALDFLHRLRERNTKSPRQVSAKALLDDIRSGAEDHELMNKYELSQRDLQSLFRQLINAGLVTALELASRLEITKSQVTEAFIEMGKGVEELD